MKKHLHNSLRALFFSLAVLLPLPILAVEVEIDGINYDIISKGKVATVIAKSSGTYSGNIVIPASVEYNGTVCSVTSIGESAFYDCSGLTSVTIPNSVASIGEYAFYGCKGLTSVTIGNSVASIGGEAFRGCSGLTSVTIPNSVTSIGEYAFDGCSGLTSVSIGNSVTSIGKRAFSGCSGLTSVHISDIAAWCNIDFKDSYTNPLNNAKHLYLNGEEVKDLVIPNSVKSIGDYAFEGCKGLTSVTIGNSVESIGYRAFYGCDGLTSVHISDIAAWCGIEFVSNSNPLYYAHHLYLNGKEVQDLVIPNSVTSIGYDAFAYCDGLTSVTIGNSVTSIGDYAFSDCSGLTSVTIGNSVTSIGRWAFAYCSGLTSVTIGNSVTSIGLSAFYSCDGLTSVSIGNSVTRIGGEAFRYCSSLTSVTIGSGIKYIASKAFANCPELLDVYCYAEKVPDVQIDVFDGSYPEYANLHVPAASIESYMATYPWRYFGKIVALTEEETGIDERKTENGNVKTEMYDLSGRRVQTAQKGIYIQNGKVIVKK